MRVITFVQRHGAYNPGETAGFSDELAASLVARGVAVDAADVPRDTVPSVPDVTPAGEERVLEHALARAAGETPVLGDPEREPDAGGDGPRPRRRGDGRR